MSISGGDISDISCSSGQDLHGGGKNGRSAPAFLAAARYDRRALLSAPPPSATGVRELRQNRTGSIELPRAAAAASLGRGDRLWAASSVSSGALNSAICYAQLCTTRSRGRELGLDSPIGRKLWT